MQTLDVISVNLWQILASLGNLCLLFWIIKRFLYKPVKNILAKREGELEQQYVAAAEAEAEALELLNVLGLSERANHKPAELSGGENQRVAVARALINHPDVVLADEPSGSLDSHNKEELHKLFFELRDRLGQTFISVTHDERLASYTDRTIRMVDGVVESEFVKKG